MKESNRPFILVLPFIAILFFVLGMVTGVNEYIDVQLNKESAYYYISNEGCPFPDMEKRHYKILIERNGNWIRYRHAGFPFTSEVRESYDFILKYKYTERP